MEKKAIIIGAGPAGLTAAFELLERTDIVPIILEKSGEIGGISRTIDYKGNRMDMGPHRFFSKSDRVMNWWLRMMPLEETEGKEVRISYQHQTRGINGDGASDKVKDPDRVMLVIRRLTRIYFLRRFFAYPIQLTVQTLRGLGVVRTVKILVSFLWIRLFPRRPEGSLADFIVNKFGSELYLLFFKDYTEKVWGVPCEQIPAEWGAQRIKGVSLSKAILEALKGRKHKRGRDDLGQKGVETSLIEQFLYPKKGPGALWEEVARQVVERGGKIYFHQEVQRITQAGGTITGVHTIDTNEGDRRVWEGDYFFSTMPVKELIAGMEDPVPATVREVAEGLQYRDFINVGILLKQLTGPGRRPGTYERLELKDNWIYIQERDVQVGRLMIYNNWGGGMINDPQTVWIGMEYFCNKTDGLWALDDETIQGMAMLELVKMGLGRVEDVLDATVQRMEKTYPAYFGTYSRFGEIRAFTDRIANLFLVGRNGMHKYNNADHSMLCAMVAVDNIVEGVVSKENLWGINTEQEYHEEKKKESMQPVYNEKAPVGEPSFIDFLWGDRWNRGLLVIGMAAYILQFFLFKAAYPFANYMPDSYAYIEAAARNLDVNMWPVAYSKFLRVVSAFTHSDKVLVGMQYFFLQLSGFFFLFSVLYLFRPGRTITLLLAAFFLFNPLPLYLSNYISADALFTGLSFLWLGQLLWILVRPRLWQLLIQALLLLLVFTVRYNAIYYPIISGLTFVLSRQRVLWKGMGIGLGCLFVFFSINYTSDRMKEETGERQFSAFGGWQLANNALYMYEHVPPSAREKPPQRFARLEGMVREHMDTLSRVRFTKEDSSTNYFYLWSGKGPLIQYMAREWKKDTTTSYFKRWASEGPLYQDYALWLIRKYPLAFAQRFLLPNALKYIVPPVEFLGIYNMGGDSVGRLAKEWFNYKTQKVQDHVKEHRGSSLHWYPVFSCLANIFLVIGVIGFLLFEGMKKASPAYKKALLLFLMLWVINMGFSVLASPIVLRYQVIPVTLSFVFALMSIRFVDLKD